MNKQRRKRISELVDQIDGLKHEISCLMDEEQQYLDNMPESMQDGEKAQKAQEAVDNLESADSYLDDVVGYLIDAAQ